MTATSTHHRDGVPGHSADSRSSGDMRRRGLLLLAGAAAIVLVVQPVGPLDYYWNPLLVGLSFVAAAAVTGPRSPLWGAGIVVSAWGVERAITNNVEISWAGGSSVIALGLGGLIVAYLGSRGWAVSPSSVAFPVLFVGIGQFVHSNTLGSGTITWYTAGLAALYGIAELLNASRRSSSSSKAHAH